MKKHRYITLMIVLVSIIVSVIVSYIVINKEELIYTYMLYDHIQYNGHDYYLADDQSYRPSNEGEERGPVYLVSKSLKVYYKNTYYAYVHTGYEGEDEELYLFFDSARYIREDYRTISPEIP